MIEVQGNVVIKDILNIDIEDTAAFFAVFGHSFEFQSIKAIVCSMLNVAQLL